MEPEPDLEADFAITFIEYENWNPLSFRCSFDPTLSTSRLGPVDSLEVRYDLDGEPGWDISFIPMRKWPEFYPPSAPPSSWEVRIEVRDRFGNVADKRRTIRLPEGVPDAPDLIMGNLLFRSYTGFSGIVDTLIVGQEYLVVAPARYWSDRLLTDCRFTASIDGLSLMTRRFPIVGPFWDYDNAGVLGPFIVTEPGVHEIVVDVEIIDDLEDSDLGNNRAARSVVFVRPTYPESVGPAVVGDELENLLESRAALLERLAN